MDKKPDTKPQAFSASKSVHTDVQKATTPEPTEATLHDQAANGLIDNADGAGLQPAHINVTN